MRLSALGALFALVLIPTVSWAQPATQLLTPPGAQKVTSPASYGIGYDMGMNMAAGGIKADDLKADDLVAGLLDALNGQEPKVDSQALRAAMEKLSAVLMQRRNAAAAEAMAASQKFLEDNKKKDGIQVTDSGLQFKVLKAGNGAAVTAASRVTVHYEGKLVNGQVFDSSLARGQPATFGVTQVIPGWQEALLRMKVGDKWQLFVPSNLAYGEQGSPPQIGPNETLIFEVELLEIN